MIRHVLFWIVLMTIGVLNGILRVMTYGKMTSDLVAHQLSTIIGILLSGSAVWYLWKHWPLESARQAWLTGIIWFFLTIIFEFGFGHFIMGHSWQLLFADYNITNGRLWLFFLIWILIMPYLFYRLLRPPA